jgi:hypothetical protein
MFSLHRSHRLTTTDDRCVLFDSSVRLILLKEIGRYHLLYERGATDSLLSMKAILAEA